MMKHLLRTAVFGLLGFSAMPGIAQPLKETLEPPLMQYTPTPQAWSMIRHGNTPVDYYTGALQVGIPLYDYSDPDFRLSVSASNASMGFMPQRQTGILGLNWFLNCGGVVTREIRGLDDFSAGSGLDGYTRGFMANGNSSVASSASYSDALLFALSIGKFYMDNDRYVCNSNVGDQGLHTTEVDADIFHFNFMGYSGKFHFDGQRKLRVYDTQGGSGTYAISIKNSENNGQLSTITISTDDGYIYTFGGGDPQTMGAALERSCRGNFDPFGRSYEFDGSAYNHSIVSWYLTSVVAPSGRRMKFSYDSGSDYPPYLPSPQNFPHYVTSFTTGLDSSVSSPSAITYYRRASVVRTTYLKRVTIDDALHIDLSYSLKNCFDTDQTNLRTYNDYASTADLQVYKIAQNLYKLDSIHVSYNRRPLRTCKFAYRIHSDRLMLDAVDVSGVGIYRMTYYEPVLNNHSGITTSSVDFWGYYNGKSNLYKAVNPMTVSSVSNDERIESPFKNPDFRYSLFGCLKRIQYPTKGFTEFEYEANTAYSIVLKRSLSAADRPVGPPAPADQPSDSEAYLASLYEYKELFSTSETGGVRICTITDHDGLGGMQKREYEYLDNGYSSGLVMYFPRFMACDRNGVKATNRNLQFPANTFDKTHIGYGAVREIYADGSYVRYEFNNYRTHPDNYNGQVGKQWQVTPDGMNLYELLFINQILREPNSNHYKRGKLNKKTLYDAQNRRVQCEELAYNDSDDEFSTYVVASGDWVYSVKKPTVDYRLTSRTVTEYFGGNTIATRTEYQYNTKGQLRRTIRYAADGRVDYTDVEYCHETFSGTAPDKLPLKYVSRIVQSNKPNASSSEAYITAAFKCTYSPVANTYKPAEASEAELTTPAAYNPLLSPFNKSLTYTGKVTYSAYDSKGNPVQITDAAGVVYSYLWGYGGMYPVVKAINATHAQLAAALGIDGAMPLTEGLTTGQIEQLYAIPGAHVNVYEYLPPIGLIRQIDPSRKEYSYEYDPHGRLIGSADQQGVLQQYEYHF